MRGATVYYLSNNQIFKMPLSDTRSVQVIYTPPPTNREEEYTINDLVCGPHNTLLFASTRVPHQISQSAKMSLKSVITSYDTVSGQSKTLVGLNDVPVRMPAASSDGSKLAMLGGGHGSPEFLIIKDFKLGTVQRYPAARIGPGSWDPDNKRLAITGIDRETEQWQVIMFDMQKGTFTPWLQGGRPMISPNGQRIAYISGSGQEKLVVANIDGKTLEGFQNFFKDINQWIDEKRVLFTSGHFYDDYLGIVDLKEKTVSKIKVPTKGEIHGACWRW